MAPMSKAEILAHCERAGRTCKTEIGCTCQASCTRPITDWVQGPSSFGQFDNPFNEPEQSMLPPAWLARLLIAVVVVVIMIAAFGPAIWQARPT